MDTSKNSKMSLNCGCMSWPGAILSIAIIAIRAFQANAEPMSSWSWWSWALMLLPAFMSIMIWLMMLGLVIFGALVSKDRWW